MKGGIGQLMKQAQEMQSNMKKAQDEMASITVTGESGAGMVRIKMTCQHQVQAVEIDDTLIGDDKEMLEDLIVAAFNDSIRKVEKISPDYSVRDGYYGMFQHNYPAILTQHGFTVLKSEIIDSKPRYAFQIVARNNRLE